MLHAAHPQCRVVAVCDNIAGNNVGILKDGGRGIYFKSSQLNKINFYTQILKTNLLPVMELKIL